MESRSIAPPRGFGLIGADAVGAAVLRRVTDDVRLSGRAGPCPRELTTPSAPLTHH